MKGVGSAEGGRKFSTANPLSEVDRLIMEARHKPGPGQYGPLLVDFKGRSVLANTTGGFSTAQPLGELDWLAKRARDVPGPGQYHLPGTGDGFNGGKFSTPSPKSDVDWLIHEAKSKPGPGQ